jgi:hypothetical protein
MIRISNLHFTYSGEQSCRPGYDFIVAACNAL